MKAAILTKLARELVQEIDSERQVVYILVELRKLMELGQAAGDPTKYHALEFYCDWAVHTTLDRYRAQRIVERFDKYQELLDKMEASGDGEHAVADLGFLGELGNTLRLEKFRAELSACLQHHKLDGSIASDPGCWTAFLTHYSRVVEGCALKCAATGLQFVDEVVVNVVEEAGHRGLGAGDSMGVDR